MSQQLWFGTGGERVRAALEAAFSWCEKCCLVSDAPKATRGPDAFWVEVERKAPQVRAAILRNLESGDLEQLRALHGSGRVRRFTEGSSLSGHFIWFERGDELRFLLAPDPLSATTVAGPGLWLFWEGPRNALPDGLQTTLDECWSSSLSLDPGDDVGAGPASGVPGYARPIPSVREVLGIRSTTSFFDLDTEAQERALWSTLIGEGAVDLEQAIRLCAERLRAQGFLDYQILRQDGRVYGAVEERLLAARRTTDLFDRPRNGFVRAIQPDLDELTAEQWRDCVIGALDEGARVDRDQAARLGFARAQDVYGAEAQRLRLGGRADQALRSAINSSIRQGYLARDGAAYLVRIAPTAEPVLRGVITSAASEPPVSAEASVQPVLAPEPTLSAEPTPLERAPTFESGQPVHASAEAAVSEAVSPEPAHSDTPSSPLDKKLEDLDLPTRAANWAYRKEIDTVRELVGWHPDVFENERNVGRRTVRETRELIETLLGCSWEEAHAAVRGNSPTSLAGAKPADAEEIDSTTEALTAGGASGWSSLGASLTEEQRAIALVDVPLPTRMKNFVRGERVELLGDLFRHSYASLANRDNIGRKSLNDTLDAVRDCLSERASPPAYATFLQAWQAQLSALEAIPRMIVTRRAGMHGARETLEELGVMLGVTRERVRQVEARVIERLRERSRWRRSVEEQVAAAFGAGRAVPLGLLAQEPWWSGIDQHELLLDYVTRRIFEDELFMLEAPSGKRYLTKFQPGEFAERLQSAKNRVEKLEYPVELSAIDQILRSEAEALDPVLFSEFELAVHELLHLDEARPNLATGYGRYRDAEVIAFLSGQLEPVPVGLVEERCGRGRLPEEVLYFKRGIVGLKRHFPDFEGWMERLVPAALEVMKERPAGRQWLVPEIHDVLRERGLVPDWLGHWHLASVLRLSGRVEYLGRLRVASKDSGHDERLHYEELFEQILEDAGGPLDFKELLARARHQTDMADGTAIQMVREAPFVRLDERRVGLVERDIPGGPHAVAAAIEAVIQTLNETQNGLTPHQATVLVNAISAVHASWTRQLVTSVLRNEPTVRIDRTKNIGLDDWDDVRCPVRAEFIRREVQQAGGKMSVAELNAKMESVYGRASDRGSLGVMAKEVGLVLSGDSILRPASITPEAPPARAGIDMSGIPTELREMFEELVQEPLSALEDLRAQVKEHVGAMEEEHHVNEFVDLDGAHVLARQCDQLLDRWAALPAPDRHLAHAAVRYFVSFDDLEHDFGIGGLDDDKQIMNAVLSYLGIHEDHEALAS